MKVKCHTTFLGIQPGEIGIITTKEGEPIDQPNNARSMWIKFDSKDMPVGIPEPFGAYIAIMKDENNS
jgi:hypothetical protein